MGIVIAGFSGIGKTILADKYKNVLDLDSAEFVYDDSDMQNIPFEQRKGEKRNLNPSWPNNYIDKIKREIKKYDIVLVWDREDIINEYLKNDIEFILCYPAKEDLNSYVERYKKRGNSDKYIKWKLEQYDEKMVLFKSLNVEKIVLTNNMTLEDYLISKNYRLIKK